MTLRTFFILALLSVSALALDITARDGTVYKSAEVTRVELDGITVTYADGVAKIMFKDLPPAIQQKYHYDPQAAARYDKSIADAKAAEVQRQQQAALAVQQAAVEQQRKSELEQQRIAEEAQQAQSAADAQRELEQKRQQESKESMETTATIASILGLCLLLLIYFLPAMMGGRKRNAGAIFVLNLFLGWTLVGWVVALVWACTKDEITREKIGSG